MSRINWKFNFKKFIWLFAENWLIAENWLMTIPHEKKKITQILNSL